MAMAAYYRWPLSRVKVSHFFLQLFMEFDYWLLNRGWPLKGGHLMEVQL